MEAICGFVIRMVIENLFSREVKTFCLLIFKKFSEKKN